MRFIRPLLSAFAAPLLFVGSGDVATATPIRAAIIALPAMNVPGGSVAMSDTQLAYTLPDPLLHVNNPNAPFTDFRNRVFLTQLHPAEARRAPLSPRLLFSGPRGAIVTLWSINDGWLVYSQYSGSDPAAPWTLAARNVATGQALVLDTSAREGLPSLAAQAASDGRTVVWQSWTRAQGHPTSIIRSYDLASGQERIMAEGGSPSTWSYGWPGVSGRQAVFEKDTPERQTPRAQVLLYNLDTGQTRSLTAAADSNSEPSISGNIVTWKQGWRYGDGHGVTIYNLRTNARRSIAGVHIEQPQATANRYVVFPVDVPARVRLYDAQADTTMTLAGPQSDGYQPGNVVKAGGQAVGYGLNKFSTTTTPNPLRFVVDVLP